jgi:hypothetical protein
VNHLCLKHECGATGLRQSHYKIFVKAHRTIEESIHNCFNKQVGLFIQVYSLHQWEMNNAPKQSLEALRKPF